MATTKPTPPVPKTKKRKMNPNSLANLKQIQSQPLAKQKAMQSAGGKASVVAKRKRKQLRDLALSIADAPVTSAKAKKYLSDMSIDPNDQTYQAMVAKGVLDAAVRGNVKAAELWSDWTAADPNEGKGWRVYHIDLDAVADPFHPIMRDVREHLADPKPCNCEYVLPGGRGSTKSSFVSQALLEILKNNKNMHAVVLRKIYNTCLDSVFAQIQWALEELEIEDEWEPKKAPLSIVNKATGQIIYFRGADKPEKIKGIKPPFGYIGVLWFEELDQFSGPNEIRKIEQSIKRGGDKYVVFKSYNPPQNPTSWANEYAIEAREDKTVLRTDYRQVPKAWLGQAFLDDAEFLRQTHPKAYEHEYLGTATGTGAQIFDNLEIRKIQSDEILEMQRYYGQDWGWYPDPNHFAGCAYDPRNMVLYIFEEHRGNKKSNEEWEKIIGKHKDTDDFIIADSSDKGNISYFQDAGFDMVATKKFPGSVATGMRWLQSRLRIVIDPDKCPDTAREFLRYESDRDPDGNVIGNYPDKDNHAIDAVRYAVQPLWRVQDATPRED